MFNHPILTVIMTTEDRRSDYDNGFLGVDVALETIVWLRENPERRERLANHLIFLAEKCRNASTGFGFE
jgi:hypothetical protein